MVLTEEQKNMLLAFEELMVAFPNAFVEGSGGNEAYESWLKTQYPIEKVYRDAGLAEYLKKKAPVAKTSDPITLADIEIEEPKKEEPKVEVPKPKSSKRKW